MYDYLLPLVGLTDGEKRFERIQIDEIIQAEKELGFIFPEELRTFYKKIGYGWLAPVGYSAYRNLIIHPLDVVELYFGRSEFSPQEGFLEGDVPFFDIGNDRFLVFRPSLGPKGPVFADFGSDQAISSGFERFFFELYQNPTFYEEFSAE